MTEQSQSPEDVQFWFDPLCPWAWITSRWMLEVQQVRPVAVDWRIMSLAYLNLVQHEGKGLSEEYLQRMQRAWGPVRVCAAAALDGGREVLGPLYTAIGTRFHQEKAERDKATVEAALAEAYDSTEYDDALRASHEEGIERVGYDVGTPIITVGDLSIFGPVVSPIPRGEAAARLWDGLVLIAGTDGFFELKRSRTRDPIFD